STIIIFSLHHPPTPANYTLSLHDALPIWIEERAALHDEIAEPGVGAHELGADDDEEREAEAHAERHDDPRQRGGDDHAPDQLTRSEEHTSELQSRFDLVCRLLLEKKIMVR